MTIAVAPLPAWTLVGVTAPVTVIVYPGVTVSTAKVRDTCCVVVPPTPVTVAT